VIIANGSTGDTTGYLLVLDNKTTSGDPTEVDGAMYYNSNKEAFRCGEGGTWRNCLGNLLTSITSVPVGNTVGNTATETAFASTYAIAANECQTGRVYRITAVGSYKASASSTIDIKVKTSGGTTGLVVLADTGVVNLVTQSSADAWRLNFNMTCDNAPSTSGAIEPEGTFEDPNEGSVGIAQASFTTATVDTTAAQTLSITIKWGTAQATSTITMRQFYVEELGQ
jgi:hypothetical protein